MLLYCATRYKDYKEEDTSDQNQNEGEDNEDLPITITAPASITVLTLPAIVMHYNDYRQFSCGLSEGTPSHLQYLLFKRYLDKYILQFIQIFCQFSC